jgi:alpha-1,3-mannosyltransferase
MTCVSFFRSIGRFFVSFVSLNFCIQFGLVIVFHFPPFQFLPEDIFVSKPLSVLLLVLHLATLAWFCRRWLDATRRSTGNKMVLFLGQPLSPQYIIMTLFTTNYIGICFARTLHYQFYSWYFHTLPYLLWFGGGRYPIALRLALLIAIESAFLKFPATSFSSALLQLSHLAILAQIQPPSPLCLNNNNDNNSAAAASVQQKQKSNKDPPGKLLRERSNKNE